MGDLLYPKLQNDFHSPYLVSRYFDNQIFEFPSSTDKNKGSGVYENKPICIKYVRVIMGYGNEFCDWEEQLPESL